MSKGYAAASAYSDPIFKPPAPRFIFAASHFPLIAQWWCCIAPPQIYPLSPVLVHIPHSTSCRVRFPTPCVFHPAPSASNFNHFAGGYSHRPTLSIVPPLRSAASEKRIRFRSDPVKRSELAARRSGRSRNGSGPRDHLPSKHCSPTCRLGYNKGARWIWSHELARSRGRSWGSKQENAPDELAILNHVIIARLLSAWVGLILASIRPSAKR